MESHYSDFDTCHSVYIDYDIYQSKSIKETVFNTFLEKLQRFTILCRFPPEINIKIWKSSTLKTRILYCIIFLIYIIVISEIIRFPWFIFKYYSTEDTRSLLAKIFLLSLKFFPGICAIFIIWNRQQFNSLIKEFGTYIPANQNTENMTKYKQVGMLYSKIQIALNVLVILVTQTLLPMLLNENIPFLDVLAFPVSRKSELYIYMLILNFITGVFTYILIGSNNILLYLTLKVLIDEFKYLSEKLEKIFRRMRTGHIEVSVVRSNYNNLIYQIINQHGILCDLLKIINRIFQSIYTITIIFFVFNCCLMAYDIANNVVTENGYILQITFGIMAMLHCLTAIQKSLQVNFYVRILF